MGVPSFDLFGGYVNFEASDNIKKSLNWVNISLAYNAADIPPDIREADLRLRYYNSTINDWESLNGTGDPAWCYGAGVDTDAKYVWANVSHFSVFAIGGVAIPPPPPTPTPTPPPGPGGVGDGRPTPSPIVTMVPTELETPSPSPTPAPTLMPSPTPSPIPTSTPTPAPAPCVTKFLVLIVIAVIVIAGIIVIVLKRKTKRKE